MKTVDLPLTSLRPAAWNANRVSAKTMAKIRRSIEEFGVVENLVARAHPDEPAAFEVISGNHRLKVLAELGLENVPVVVVELGDADARLLAQTLNRTRGKDDPVAYAKLLEHTLAAVGAEKTLALLPETEASIDRVLATLRPAVDEAPVDLPETADSRPGEVYELGPHRLMCGDSREAELPDGALVTDPPYGVGYEHETWDDHNQQTNDGLFAWVESLGRSPTVYFCGSVNLSRELNRAEAKVLIWHKPWSTTHSGIGNGRHHWEPIITRRIPRGAYLATDVLVQSTDRIPGLRDEHSCPKPVQLIADLIAALVPDRDTLIVDPFGGSGTTLIAAEHLGRRSFLMEIDPRYCDVIRKRYAAAVGEKVAA